MAGTEMKLEIPQSIIREVVQAQVVAALGKSEQLIAGVVAEALESKRRDAYSNSPSIFAEQTSAMIREVAIDAFKGWLAENKEKVRAELRKQLTAQKGKVITSIVDQFTGQISNISARIDLTFPKD